MQYLNDLFEDYFSKVYMPSVTVIDIIEIAIIAFVIYHVMVWIKKTKAWVLLKGITVLVAFSLVAVLLNLKTILWIASKTISVGVIALVVIFQPELRKALEQLGRRRLISSILPSDDNKDKGERFSNRTINELIKATYELARTKTGALIVIEQDIELTDYEKTGIEIDALLTSQLLINIFEHNTPLHDGAVIVRGNRIRSATCYLPLSDNMQLSKALGTRHRAGVGISEACDAMTLIVSEETGKISVAYKGELTRNLKAEDIEKHLSKIQNKPTEEKKKRILNINRNKSK